MSSVHDRERLFDHLAQILGSGYTLKTADISYMMPYYGYDASNSKSYGSIIMRQTSAQQALLNRGVKLVIESHMDWNTYRDDNLEVQDTDLERTKNEIDREISANQASTIYAWHREPVIHLASEEIEAIGASEAVQHIAKCRSCAAQVIAFANPSLIS